MVSVVLLVVWVGSGWWNVQWVVSPRLGLGIAQGCFLRFIDENYDFVPGFSAGRNFAWSRFHVEWLFVNRGPFLAIPLWPVIVLSLFATAFAWRLDALARRRARAGFCPKCNYDRTGLAPGAVCPECGAAAVHR